MRKFKIHTVGTLTPDAVGLVALLGRAVDINLSFTFCCNLRWRMNYTMQY